MTLSISTDIVVIGAGSAGLAAIKEVQKQTDQYLLVNAGSYGTTCARVGCMPSKLLIEAANAFHRRHSFEAFGIRQAEKLEIDIAAVFKRVRELRDYYVSSVLDTVDALGSKNISGKAIVKSPNRVEVNGQLIECKKIIIATGSRPVVPEAWNMLGDKLLTTDNLFEQPDLKSHIAVIGMGAIGVEMAQALSRLGIRVSAVSTIEQVAGLTDPVVNQDLIQILNREYDLYLGQEAELSKTQTGVEVTVGDAVFEVDQVLAAVGRQPNLDNIGLENLGVPLDANGIPDINPQTMQLADLPVFIAGDAGAHSMLLHEVADEGRIAGHNAASQSIDAFRRRTSLQIVFCDPEVASVGKKFEDCDLANTLIGQVDYQDQGRARAGQRNTGLMRLYADKSSERLIGAEMAVPAAEHMVHLLALAIEQKLTIEEILRMPIYHPVLEEGMRTALRELQSQMSSNIPFDLSRCEAFDSEALD
ncbi:dihydrolipoyl dehydrogenase [Methylophaga sp.]|uniref:dihydrolipoyl dehydrogenase n=1 Tax=Methylophaga sp. TaxID=2024840 RepID=UPI003F6A4C38